MASSAESVSAVTLRQLWIQVIRTLMLEFPLLGRFLDGESSNTGAGLQLLCSAGACGGRYSCTWPSGFRLGYELVLNCRAKKLGADNSCHNDDGSRFWDSCKKHERLLSNATKRARRGAFYFVLFLTSLKISNEFEGNTVWKQHCSLWQMALASALATALNSYSR